MMSAAGRWHGSPSIAQRLVTCCSAPKFEPASGPRRIGSTTTSTPRSSSPPAQGHRAFCAGGDLKEMADTSLEVPGPGFLPQFGWNVAVPKPTIAAVNGVAFAGGFLPVQMCDLCVAAESALFGIMEAPVLGRGAPWAAPLPDIVGRRAALQFLLTAEPVDALDARAMELGQPGSSISGPGQRNTASGRDDCRKCALVGPGRQADGHGGIPFADGRSLRPVRGNLGASLPERHARPVPGRSGKRGRLAGRAGDRMTGRLSSRRRQPADTGPTAEGSVALPGWITAPLCAGPIDRGKYSGRAGARRQREASDG